MKICLQQLHILLCRSLYLVIYNTLKFHGDKDNTIFSNNQIL